MQIDHDEIMRRAAAISPTLSATRRMHIYTPPGYEKSTESYPVFYLLHGAGDSDDSWWTVGRAPLEVRGQMV